MHATAAPCKVSSEQDTMVRKKILKWFNELPTLIKGQGRCIRPKNAIQVKKKFAVLFSGGNAFWISAECGIQPIFHKLRGIPRFPQNYSDISQIPQNPLRNTDRPVKEVEKHIHRVRVGRGTFCRGGAMHKLSENVDS